MSELSLNELEAQHSELLPEREALGHINFGSFDHDTTYNNNVSAHNTLNANRSFVLANEQVNEVTIYN